MASLPAFAGSLPRSQLTVQRGAACSCSHGGKPALSCARQWGKLMFRMLSAVMLVLAAIRPADAQPVAPDIVKELAPTGKLRAAINVSNIVLTQKDPAGGDPRGITVDLAREVARKL